MMPAAEVSKLKPRLSTAVHVALREMKAQAVRKQTLPKLKLCLPLAGTSNCSSHPPTLEQGRWREHRNSCPDVQRPQCSNPVRQTRCHNSADQR